MMCEPTASKIYVNYSSTATPLPSTSPHSYHIADTDASTHFGNMNTPCHDRIPTDTGIAALLPNNSRLQSTHLGLLPIYSLPTSARTIHLFKQFREPLLSIGVLCDHGCEAKICAKDVLITKKNDVILTGQ